MIQVTFDLMTLKEAAEFLYPVINVEVGRKRLYQMAIKYEKTNGNAGIKSIRRGNAYFIEKPVVNELAERIKLREKSPVVWGNGSFY